MRTLKLGLAALALSATALPANPVSASSHREAPLIASDPCADNVDLYAFASPDVADTVTIIANYIPLEEPSGGPNFHKFCDDVLYTIHVDNSGDAKDDVAFQFRFKTTILNPNTFNYNLGSITAPDAAPLTFKQEFTLTYVDAGGSHAVGTGPVAPANIGPRSYGGAGGYDAVWMQAIKTLTYMGKSIKVFTGPIDDPFYVDLGAVFDLVGIRGSTAPDSGIPGSSGGLVMGGAGGGNVGNHGGGFDSLAGFNTHTIAIQVPYALVAKGGVATRSALSATSPDSVIGVWASAARPRITVRREGPRTVDTHGQFVQVSRLGLPLINELLIPLAKKDYWNSQSPATEVATFGAFYLDPEPARDAAILYPSFFGSGAPFAVPAAPRNDIVALAQFLPGVFCSLPGAPSGCMTTWTNQIAPSDLLRLNLAIAPVAGTPANRMAALQGDFAGFPNGRRLSDDVVDIVEQVVIGGALVAGRPAGMIPPLGDGVDQNDKAFGTAFPYVATPHQGFLRSHVRYEPVH